MIINKKYRPQSTNIVLGQSFSNGVILLLGTFDSLGDICDCYN